MDTRRGHGSPLGRLDHGQAFIWTHQTGTVGLGTLANDTYSTAKAVSADGSVIVGYSGGGRAFRWTQEAGMVGLGVIPGGSGGRRALGVSADGRVIVGEAGSTPFIWRESTGMLPLGELPHDWGSARARVVSDDGTVVLGFNNRERNYVWTANDGYLETREWLKSHGFDTEWSFVRVADVSADGRTFVGWGYRPDNAIEAWVARLPGPKPFDTNGDEVVDIDDLALTLANFGRMDAALADGDVNGDGVVNITDVGYVLAHMTFPGGAHEPPCFEPRREARPPIRG